MSAASKALADAITVFDVNATIADEDVEHWNEVIWAAQDARTEIEQLRSVLGGLLEVLPSLWTDKRIADKCTEARRTLEGGK